MNQKRNFRMARSGDAAQVLSLYHKAKTGAFCVWDDAYPTMTEIRQDLDAKTLYVLTQEDRVIGAISVVPENELDELDCWTKKDGKEIARVVIDTDFQGQGLAFEMVENIQSVLEKTGQSAIHLAVAEANIPAYRTYQRAGFSKVGEADLFGHHYTLMEMILNP